MNYDLMGTHSREDAGNNHNLPRTLWNRTPVR